MNAGFTETLIRVSLLKSINILSLAQAHKSLSDEELKKFKQHYGIELKKSEHHDLNNLLDVLCDEITNPCLFSGFYVGYKIPQIGKEFDLLKISNNAIVNIELKQTSSAEKILKQLQRNYYYLSFTGKEIYSFTYSSDTESLYMLDMNSNLIESSLNRLQDILFTYSDDFTGDIDSLFNPSDYLVSPFNSTDKFIKNQYFLTHQQEEFKGCILKALSNNSVARFVSLTGAAGTGKTLLVYDLVKNILSEGGKVLVVHCGNLNNGHNELKKLGWDIIAIKAIKNTNLKNYNTILIDEAQRIYSYQLTDLISFVKSNKKSCIFSYDKLQTLGKQEEWSGVVEEIGKICGTQTYKLSEKIRTNKEIANFIRMLFSIKSVLEAVNSSNIIINYFDNTDDARDYLFNLDHQEWEVLRFTPSQYNKEYHENYSYIDHKKSHEIIGQEFDNVAVTIDEHFDYDSDGKLIYAGRAYYNPLKMFFQNITRTRKKLNVVIINNKKILNRCLSILK